ncbi:50S ribosomal protein L19 [candidate division WOR-3 bacterium]|nr:50S ribosomal protein L19 [candidate division WOR-3 bacterium]
MQEITDFRVGDKIKVWTKLREGERERTQIFEGIVIKKKGCGVSKTFTVRRLSYGIGIERIFPLHSPNIDQIRVVKQGKVRRAKLYYLRGRKGKSAMRVKER